MLPPSPQPQLITRSRRFTRHHNRGSLRPIHFARRTRCRPLYRASLISVTRAAGGWAYKCVRALGNVSATLTRNRQAIRAPTIEAASLGVGSTTSAGIAGTPFATAVASSLVSAGSLAPRLEPLGWLLHERRALEPPPSSTIWRTYLRRRHADWPCCVIPATAPAQSARLRCGFSTPFACQILERRTSVQEDGRLICNCNRFFVNRVTKATNAVSPVSRSTPTVLGPAGPSLALRLAEMPSTAQDWLAPPKSPEFVRAVG